MGREKVPDFGFSDEDTCFLKISNLFHYKLRHISRTTTIYCKDMNLESSWINSTRVPVAWSVVYGYLITFRYHPDGDLNRTNYRED